VSLSDFKGQRIILYFYPQDNTPTCTIEACNLRDNHRFLKKEGYKILGVSPDSVKKHSNFVKKFKLPFDLLSDPNLEIINKYEVWGEKTTFGRTYMGVYRSTYIIDAEGKVERVISDVKSKEHAQQILQ
jgi:peroxiredoxin Q/BCP